MNRLYAEDQRISNRKMIINYEINIKDMQFSCLIIKKLKILLNSANVTKPRSLIFSGYPRVMMHKKMLFQQQSLTNVN